jgi:hypothetical protein
MPSYNAYIHGNLPVEVELGAGGDFQGMSTWLRNGVKWLDISNEEYFALIPDHLERENNCLEEYRRDKAGYDKMIGREE